MTPIDKLEPSGSEPGARATSYGAAPYHVKGVMLHGILEWADRHVEGGRVRILAESSPELAEYVGGRFLSASWVDVFAVADLSVVASRCVGKGHLATVRHMALEQCERDVKGIYAAIIRLATPDMILQRVPRSANLYFDFVTAEVEKLGPGHYRSLGHGVPVPALHSYMAVTETFLTRVLEIAGARGIQHRWLSPVAEGYEGSVPRLCARREIRWQT